MFAPTDAAFAKVPKATLAALAKDKAKLKAVLLYHVVSGKFTAAQVVKQQSLTTLEGGTLSIRTRHGKVYVNRARVIKANVDGIQRRDPRDQPGADPALTHPTSSGRRRCGALTGAGLRTGAGRTEKPR